ncbi:MAG: alpha/beta hydrolase domain-containing protein [Gammaproteobacteria bacterium]|nr:alpha/beta hydrolase domain-containing protein [Gammaproteobacteria bacterium]
MKQFLLLAKLLAVITITFSSMAQAQRNFTAPNNLPTEPTVVAIPQITPNTGSGTPYDSATGLWPGHGLDHFDYVADEYVMSGNADGEPYTARLVVRHPEDMSRFSGMVIAEPMHPAGFAHGFEHNSVYIMDAGHIAVEVTTMGLEHAINHNPGRYAGHQVSNNQINEILAQTGALMKSQQSPIAGSGLRKVILFGTSATSRLLTDFLPVHKVFTLADGNSVFDGFMPTSNGSRILPVDVPMIQMPTQHEFMNIATAVQDSDEPGSEFRVYEFNGIGHLMARHNPRMTPQLCNNKPSEYPLELYFSVALHHLFEWVDKDIAPPRGDRVLIDRNMDNDGSLMVLDAHGNPTGGIRNPYVDVPFATYIAGDTLADGQDPAMSVVCRLSVYEEPFSAQKLRQLYGSKANFLRQFEDNLNEHETAGWSLPVYHDLIMADARAVDF